MNLHSVLFDPAADEVDQLVAELYERGTAGIIEEGSRLRAFFENEADYHELLAMYVVLEVRQESAPDAEPPLNEDYDPVLAGNRFFIVPALSTRPTPEGRYRLPIHETTAFGTGRHESTQLMLAAMEQFVIADGSVVDIGAGTGILSMAAHLLGARPVWGCDINEDGVRSSHLHYGLPAFAGSVDAIREHVADVTLANISPRILDLLAHDLRRVTKPEGKVLISGFLQGGEPTRFQPDLVWEQEGWLCWLCRPQHIDAGRARPGVAIHAQDWWQ